jgi:carbon-monoxide dehydrogenase medium subunit
LPIRAGAGSAYEKVERRVGDWAVAAAGAMVVLSPDGTIEDATIGLTAVGLEGLAVDAAAVLLGQRPGEKVFADAGRLAAEASSPVEDQRGPVDYKRHLADELTRRVLRTAAARAGALADVSGG